MKRARISLEATPGLFEQPVWIQTTLAGLIQEIYWERSYVLIADRVRDRTEHRAREQLRRVAAPLWEQLWDRISAAEEGR